MNIKTNPSRNISVWLRMLGIWWENKFLKFHIIRSQFKHFQGQFKFFAIQAIVSLCLSAKVNKKSLICLKRSMIFIRPWLFICITRFRFLATVTFVLHNVNKMKFNFICCLRCESFICWSMHLTLSSFIVYFLD